MKRRTLPPGKKRALVLSSLGAVLLAGGGATWYAADAAADVAVVSCFCPHGRESAARIAADSRVLVAGTVRDVRAFRRPDLRGEGPRRVVRARLVVDAAFKHAVPSPEGISAGTVLDVEQSDDPYEGFWASLSEGRRYTVSLSPWTRADGSSYDVEAVEETPDRAAGDARWRVAAADGERLPDPCDAVEARYREEYGVDDVFLDWLT
ncbi:hypothetical protein ACFVU3_29765 [Streptomyces sp. NPDC058052]|uniref:hypothetical protein n=1 Tax=Streptomyces sp. NPDC058052 TaxID=3346316 RepID=UPI0036E56169